ncbi:MAG: CBS domain-containing protein [Patescibacteria group bacterium]|nr:CBS domain-containing protein [Patescibacteria group bacterium]
MIYLSQLLNKTIYYQNKPYGKIRDFAVVENRPIPPVSKILVKTKDKKITLPSSAIKIENNNIVLITHDVPMFPYEEKDFYLSEDLLDKQVIDTDGRRLVRVNDVLLESNGELKVVGIDIGFSGIIRRLGLEKLIKLKHKTLPWALVEAFDYQTGAVKIKLTQTRLSSFHPAELADILEEVGTKERLGIVESLDAQKAAEAIEEANNQTQLSILEQVSASKLKNIVNRMLTTEIADIFYKLNPLKIKEIMNFLGTEKAQEIKKISKFPDDAAGGLMDISWYSINGEKTVKEVLMELSEKELKPEAIIVNNGGDKFLGTVYLKDLINIDHLAILKDIIIDRKFVYPDTDFSETLRLFTQYNLHILPVLDRDKKVIGVITVDRILARIEEEKEKNDIL